LKIFLSALFCILCFSYLRAGENECNDDLKNIIVMSNGLNQSVDVLIKNATASDRKKILKITLVLIKNDERILADKILQKLILLNSDDQTALFFAFQNNLQLGRFVIARKQLNFLMKLIEENGAKVLIDKISLLYYIGLTYFFENNFVEAKDYIQQSMQEGLKIHSSKTMNDTSTFRLLKLIEGINGNHEIYKKRKALNELMKFDPEFKTLINNFLPEKN